MKVSKKAENAEQAAIAEEKAKTPAETCELDDDLLDGVAGGLVQLVNPSSSRL